MDIAEKYIRGVITKTAQEMNWLQMPHVVLVNFDMFKSVVWC